jgi:hypothetical protein
VEEHRHLDLRRVLFEPRRHVGRCRRGGRLAHAILAKHGTA